MKRTRSIQDQNRKKHFRLFFESEEYTLLDSLVLQIEGGDPTQVVTALESLFREVHLNRREDMDIQYIIQKKHLFMVRLFRGCLEESAVRVRQAVLGIWSRLTYYDCFPLVYTLRQEDHLPVFWQLVTLPCLPAEASSLTSVLCLLRNLIHESEVILNYLIKANLSRQLMIWQHQIEPQDHHTLVTYLWFVGNFIQSIRHYHSQVNWRNIFLLLDTVVPILQSTPISID